MSRSGRVLLALVFAAWCAATIAGAVAHEPWWDEAQAWLIARDSPLLELFTQQLRYEGHPPLWYLILAVPAKLGLPYASLKVIGVLCGAASAFLLLFGFPRVPLYVRVLGPFGLFVAYQYTVVVRSYALILPLLLLIARMYDARHQRPGRLVVLLIVLSNVSVHGFAIACGLGALFLFDVASGRVPRPSRRAFLTSAAAFVLNAIVLAIVLWPAGDNRSYVHHHGRPFDPARHTFIATSVVPDLFLAPMREESPVLAVTRVTLAMTVLAIPVLWIFRRGAGAPFVLALLGVYAITLRYYAMWHLGLFYFVLLFALVLAFERRRHGALDKAAQVAIALLLLRHAEWAARSLRYDLRAEATGSKRAAEFVGAQGLHHRQLYGTGAAVIELQPYFPANIIDNYRYGGRTFWDYSSGNAWPYPKFTTASRQEMSRWFARLLAERPEYIVYAGGILEDELYAPGLFRNSNYVRMASFGGYTYWKDAEMWRITFHVFRRADMPPASGPRSVAR
ncbi:MAG TPA: hypothetical protein VNI54_07790 [Thermoanaerobaculia bacterium]|nr:hypothetical protein [Thermoanaerobaculia bacterium]